MNVNLLKRFFQNSKECSKIIHNISHDVFHTSRFSRHIGSYTRLSIHRVGSNSKISASFYMTKRCYCQGNESGSSKPTFKLPPLMSFPSQVWPSILKSIKNLILTTFIIKPYLDPEFNISEFIIGSKKAVEVVSHKVSHGEDLEGFVTSDIIPKLRDSVANMSLAQRELIPVKSEDIYFAFPYQIGIIFSDEENQKRFVEITMVYHSVKGLASMRSMGEEPPLNVGPEYQDRISICNYRFIKEFTKGVDSDWTINLLNHFRPIDDDY